VPDTEAQCDACYAVSYISDGENSRIQAVIDANFLPPIAHILSQTEQQSLRSAALRVIGNVLTGDESQTQSVLDLNILPTLSTLLESPRSRIRKEACWSISNVTAGSVPQIQAVIDAQLIPKLLKIGYSSPPDICKECIWCLANATEQKNLSQLQYFVEQGAIPFLAWSLNSSSETQLLSVVLSAINNIVLTDPSFHELVAIAAGARLQQLRKSINSEISALLDSICAMLQCALPGDDQIEDDQEVMSLTSLS
jgi:hypothetical protein